MYPFGFGLSYTKFEYGKISLNRNNFFAGDSIVASVKIKNAGKVEGEEIVQLYIRDMVGSVTRPVKELKRFEKIRLDPGEEKTVTFSLTTADLKFYDINMNYLAEPGEFRLYIGPDSRNCAYESFTLKI